MAILIQLKMTSAKVLSLKSIFKIIDKNFNLLQFLLFLFVLLNNRIVDFHLWKFLKYQTILIQLIMTSAKVLSLKSIFKIIVKNLNLL